MPIRTLTRAVIGVFLLYAFGNAMAQQNTGAALATITVSPNVTVPVKASPDPFSATIDHVDNGGSFQSTGKVGDWFQIKKGDMEGYIFKDYVTSTRTSKQGGIVDTNPPSTVKPKEEVKKSESEGDLQSEHNSDAPTQTGPATERVEPQPTEIEQLLSRADHYVENDQLTTPPHENAFDIYQRVLSMDPTNEAAKNGLSRIADRYYRLARASLDRGDNRKSRILVERGLRVDGDHAGLVSLSKRLKPEEHVTGGNSEATYQAGLAMFFGLNGVDQRQRSLPLVSRGCVPGFPSSSHDAGLYVSQGPWYQKGRWHGRRIFSKSRST